MPLPNQATNTIWDPRVIGGFLQLTTYFGSFTFLAIQYDQVGSPPAHRQQIQPQILTDYTGSALGARLIGADLPLFIAFSN